MLSAATTSRPAPSLPSSSFAIPERESPMPNPAPVPNPAPAPSPAARAPVPGRADLDPDNDGIVAPPDIIPDCEALLTAAGVRFHRAELRLNKSRSGYTCGAPQVVVYRGGPDGPSWKAPPLVTCGLALAFVRFEAILREESEQRLGSRVVSIDQGGTYNCREMARFAHVSEHSYANAIDVRSFRLADGRAISVKHYFGRPSEKPKGPEGAFLRALARRLYDEEVFSVVLTEYFDRLHRDHFHLDMARYRVDGTR